MLLCRTEEEAKHTLKLATQARENAPWYQHRGDRLQLPYEQYLRRYWLRPDEGAAAARAAEATPPCAAKAAIPCGLAVRKQHEMLFAASKFEGE